MDIKEAYKILELEYQTDDFEEIEKQYAKLLKKYRYKDLNDIKDTKTLEDIGNAYNCIMEHFGRGHKDNRIYTKSEIYKNFLYYHKFHIIVTIIILSIVGSFVYSYVTKKDPDFTLIAEGNVLGDTEKAQKVLNKIDKRIKNSQVVVINLNPKSDPTQLNANIVKSTTFLMSKVGDIYVIDKDRYDKMIKDDLLEDLNKYVDLKKIKKDDLLIKKNSNNEVCGVNVSKNEVFKKLDLKAKELILVKTRGKKINKNAQIFINAVFE